MEKDAQSLFESRYITAQQIADYVDVTRVSVFNARKSGKLPGSIAVGATFVWERDQIQPYIETWRETLRISRSVAA